MAKRLSPTKIRKILNLSRAGHSKNQIKEITGHTWKTIEHVLSRHTQDIAEPVTEPITLWTADKDPLRDVLQSNLTPITKVRLASLLLDERRG